MSGLIAKTMMWLLLAFAASAQAQTVEYLHTDALGSVVAVTNASRTVLERREYEPYGSQLTPAVTNGPGYTGHVQDAATGLVYMQQRYYDAQIGRFLSVDPVTANSGTEANFNRYWYADNNPYTFIDPTGTCTGSRIENGDGTCRSSGGNTTETYRAQEGEGRSANSGGSSLVPSESDLKNLGTGEDSLEATVGITRLTAYGVHSYAYSEWLRLGPTRALATAGEYLPTLRTLSKAGRVMAAVAKPSAAFGPLVSGAETVTGRLTGNPNLEARGMSNLSVDVAILGTGPGALVFGPLWGLLNVSGARDAIDRQTIDTLKMIQNDGIWRPVGAVY